MKIARLQSRFRKYDVNKGFTLIELLVVVLILSILMAISTPLSLQAVADSQRKSCRSNMQTIANAVQSARVRVNAADYSALISGGVTTANLADFQHIPVCSAGGSYSLGVGHSGDSSTFKVTCSFGDHGTFEPGEDAR